LVSVIIFLENNSRVVVDDLRRLLAETRYSNVEWLIIVPEFFSFSEELVRIDEDISLVEANHGEGKVVLLNRAAHLGSGDYLAFLDESTLTSTGDWIVALLEYGQDYGVGFVGGRLKYKNKGDEVKLLVPDVTNSSPSYYAEFIRGCSTHMNGLQCPQNVLVVSPVLCMVRKKLFDTSEGFAENSYQDLFFIHDLCLRLREKGYENIYTPYCHAVIDIKSRNHAEEDGDQRLRKEQAIFKQRWETVLRQGDPYWNKGLLKEKGISLKKFSAWYADCGQG